MRAAISVALVAACSSSPAVSQDQSLRVPDGFKVSVFATNLDGVRYLTLGPGNVVYASLPGDGVIVKLPDANGDGVADSTITVARGLRGPFGIAFRGDTMYVAEMVSVKRFDPGAREPVTIVRGLPSGGHVTRTV